MNKPRIFVIFNYIAILGHLLSFSTMLYLLSVNDSVNFPLTENYLKWETTTNNSICPLGSREFETTNQNFCVVSSNSPISCDDDGKCIGLDLGWLVTSFHILSFVFQLSAALTDYLKKPLCGYKYSEMILSGKNPLRFIEYSISASIMLIAIALLNGVTSLDLILSIGVLTSMCQISGLVVEYLDNIKLKWLLHFTGWVQFIAAYLIIYRAFNNSVVKSETNGPPEFVYIIVLVLFLLYGCFGMVQLTELFCECKCCEKLNMEDKRTNKCLIYVCPSVRENNKCNPVYKEVVYIILSLTAKLILGWLIFTNVLVL